MSLGLIHFTRTVIMEVNLNRLHPSRFIVTQVIEGDHLLYDDLDLDRKISPSFLTPPSSWRSATMSSATLPVKRFSVLLCLPSLLESHVFILYDKDTRDGCSAWFPTDLLS